jgi:hypothetical protein
MKQIKLNKKNIIVKCLKLSKNKKYIIYLMGRYAAPILLTKYIKSNVIKLYYMECRPDNF